MKNKMYYLGSLFILIFLIGNCSEKKDFPVLKGPYLGQKPPGMTPELFAPGLLSAGGDEANITFTPDGMELCYTLWTPGGENLADPKWPFLQMIVMHSKEKNGRWTEPKEFSFNPLRKEIYPFFSPDGKRMYFLSFRSGSSRVMFAEKSNGEWCDPKEIDLQISSFISVAASGNIYCVIMDKDTKEVFIYMSRYENGKYSLPEKLSDAINGEGGGNRPYIAPDESYVIFDREESWSKFGEEDLFISFRDQNGEWTKAQNMGKDINTGYRDKRPFVSFDGKYLFFASDRIENTKMPEKAMNLTELKRLLLVPANGWEHIYWVDAKVIDEFRPKN
jgi:hypothetical protein